MLIHFVVLFFSYAFKTYSEVIFNKKQLRAMHQGQITEDALRITTSLMQFVGVWSVDLVHCDSAFLPMLPMCLF